MEHGSLGGQAINLEVFVGVACHVPGTGLSRAAPGKRFGADLERLLVPADDGGASREVASVKACVPSAAAAPGPAEVLRGDDVVEPQEPLEQKGGSESKAGQDARTEKSKPSNAPAAKAVKSPQAKTGK